MRRRWLSIVIAPAVLALLGGVLLYRETIRHGFSAREKPWPIEEFAALRLRRLAMGSEAKQRMNPLSPSPELLAEAREHFADHCAICHGEDGSGETEIGQGLYPPVPDLRAPRTQQLTDGELFSIIENGVRFTGMPGWGEDEPHHWKMVLYIRHLPDLPDQPDLPHDPRAPEHRHRHSSE